MQSQVMQLIRSIKGAPLSILVVFVLENRELGHNYLVKVTGYSKDTVTQGLRVLGDLGLIFPVPGIRYNGWILTDKLLDILRMESSAKIQDSFVLSSDETPSIERRNEVRQLLHNAGIRGAIANKIILDSTITPEDVRIAIQENRGSPTLLAKRILNHL